jgi:hypothetical protein
VSHVTVDGAQVEARCRNALKIKGCLQINPGHVHRLPSLCSGGGGGAGSSSMRSGGLKAVAPGDSWDMLAASVACDSLCITSDLLDKIAACRDRAPHLSVLPPHAHMTPPPPPPITPFPAASILFRRWRLRRHFPRRAAVPQSMGPASCAGGVSCFGLQRDCGLMLCAAGVAKVFV